MPFLTPVHSQPSGPATGWCTGRHRTNNFLTVSSGVILALGAFQLPAFGSGSAYITTWAELESQIQGGSFAAVLGPNAVITAPLNAIAITNGAHNPATILNYFEPDENSQTITGPGGSTSVFINEGGLAIVGNSTPSYLSNAGGLAAAIQNIKLHIE